MKRVNNAVLGLTGLLILVIGFALGKSINVPGISLDKSINPVHLISALVPLLIALVVTYLLGQRREKITVAKGLLIEKISRVEVNLDKILDEATSNSLHISAAAHAIKKSDASMKQIYEAFSKNGLVVETTIRSIQSQMHHFKGRLTDTPIKGKSDKNGGVKVVDGIASYDLSRLTQIENALDELNSTLLQLQLDVNSN